MVDQNMKKCSRDYTETSIIYSKSENNIDDNHTVKNISTAVRKNRANGSIMGHS